MNFTTHCCDEEGFVNNVSEEAMKIGKWGEEAGGAPGMTASTKV